MAWECPRGFERYRDVLFSFSDVRGMGKWVVFRCLLEGRHKNGDRNWSGLMWIGNSGELVAKCLGCGARFRELVAASGSDPRDWFPDKGGRSRDQRGARRMAPKPVLVATYAYKGREGELLYEKQRFEPGFDGRGKSLRFRRPFPHRLRVTAGVPAGVESWVYGIQAQEYGRRQVEGEWDWYPLRDEHQHWLPIDGADPVLYRLPELAAANKAAPVFVTEGEKDCDLLRSLGFVAVCGPYGSSQWPAHFSKDLAGRRVVVVPDADEVGLQHADRVAGSCLRHGAASVRVVSWDDGLYDPGPGGGAGNWLPRVNPTGDREVGRNAVIDLCKQSPEYAGAKAAAS